MRMLHDNRSAVNRILSVVGKPNARETLHSLRGRTARDENQRMLGEEALPKRYEYSRGIVHISP